MPALPAGHSTPADAGHLCRSDRACPFARAAGQASSVPAAPVMPPLPATPRPLRREGSPTCANLKSGARHLPEKPNEIKGGRANIGINRPMNRIRSRIVGALARCVAVQVTARSSRAFAGPSCASVDARRHGRRTCPLLGAGQLASTATSLIQAWFCGTSRLLSPLFELMVRSPDPADVPFGISLHSASSLDNWTDGEALP